MADAIASVRFVVPGEPVPQPRARRGKGGHWYTPGKVKRYREAIAWTCVDAMKGPLGRGGRPVRVEVTFVHTPPTRPKRLERVRAHVDAGLLVPMVGRPDVDNCLKGVLDGLTGVAWDDDEQVFDVRAIQFWGKEPSTTVEIEVFPATVGPK